MSLISTSLQESTTGLIIAIMPFDAIMLTNRFEGLCVPALGVRRYQLMSRALMELLPRLIPGTLSPQINAALSSVRYESNNGYDYLWRVLELTVPGFDPVVPIQIPYWSNADDVFSFAQSYLLYFRLQSKQNFHYDDRTRSSIFLRAIQFSDFADTVTTLQSHVNSFREQYDDGYLPPHLRIHGLATSINQNTQARMREVISPQGSTSEHHGAGYPYRPPCRSGRSPTRRLQRKGSRRQIRTRISVPWMS
jgi:hypothetical protein